MNPHHYPSLLLNSYFMHTHPVYPQAIIISIAVVSRIELAFYSDTVPVWYTKQAISGGRGKGIGKIE